jgi:hypothetical protein
LQSQKKGAKKTKGSRKRRVFGSWEKKEGIPEKKAKKREVISGRKQKEKEAISGS